ncbi:MAG: hypothetical protein DA329_02490 [Candidatus Nitrosocosmicus sp.]|nr:hypothetical protein [Candidatus Nitrosocosmicus sp.]
MSYFDKEKQYISNGTVGLAIYWFYFQTKTNPSKILSYLWLLISKIGITTTLNLVLYFPPALYYIKYYDSFSLDAISF